MKYDDAAVPGTPVKVKATTGFDPKRVKVFGPGIESGFVNTPNDFTIETIGAGNGGLGLSIVGPTEAKVKCLDNRNGVSYTLSFWKLVRRFLTLGICFFFVDLQRFVRSR